MAWACAVFGNYQIDLMKLLYVGLVGAGREQSPSYMSSIHGDGGLQLQVTQFIAFNFLFKLLAIHTFFFSGQAIMTLVYVQIAMELEGSSVDLSLPEGFPDGWQQLSPLRNENDGNILIEKSFELNLSTSKIQRSVSSALSRLSFDHVEEHTITMKEMAEVYNVNVPRKEMEILSIDIANVKDKIAIEVDGPAHFISRIDSPVVATSGYTKASNGKIEYQFGWNGDKEETNGPTFLKDRLLKSFGWNVLHVPFWDWYALGGDATKEDEYCEQLLAKLTKS
jgi:RAP domain